jgi:hypothetical protein
MARLRITEIDRICDEQVSTIVQEWREFRPRDRIASQIVILRGMFGSGKSTFAALLKIVAEANGFSAQICSADDYFRSRRYGYLWQPDRLDYVHRECREDAQWALWRQVDFVIIDNANTLPNEWGPFVDMAFVNGMQLHSIIRVNFACANLDEAVDMSRRRQHRIPEQTVVDRFRLYEEHTVAFHAHYACFPPTTRGPTLTSDLEFQVPEDSDSQPQRCPCDLSRVRRRAAESMHSFLQEPENCFLSSFLKS